MPKFLRALFGRLHWCDLTLAQRQMVVHIADASDIRKGREGWATPTGGAG